MEMVKTSGGRSMNSGSMRPMSTTGHSTRPVTSSSSAGSSLSTSLARAAFRLACFSMTARRSAGSRITLAAFSFFL